MALPNWKIHALGARYFFPEAPTILDIGRQNGKVIRLDRQGKVVIPDQTTRR